MKKYFLFLTMVVSAQVFAQQQPKVLLHLQSSDSLVHKSTVMQIANLKKEMPDAEIELVCHGPGIEFLLNAKSKYVNRVDKMKLKGVSVVGCEFTMAQKNIKKEDLVPFAKTVPFAIVEIVKKEQDNWLYIKVGF